MNDSRQILECDTDFEFGVVLDGKVCGIILTARNLIQYLINEL